MTVMADASSIARTGSPAASGTTGRREQWQQRGVGTEHEDAGRAHQEVADEGPDRRVQAGDRRQPGRLRVAHPDRDQDRGQGEARRDVRPDIKARVRPADPLDRREDPKDLDAGRPSETRP